MATIAPEMPKVEKIAGVDKWEAESAARAIEETFEIKAKPKLFNAAMIVLKRKQKAAKKALGWAGRL